MLAALAVRYAQQKPPSWAAGEDTKRARGESSLKKVKEGSDDRRIKSAGPSRPAVGERRRHMFVFDSKYFERGQSWVKSLHLTLGVMSGSIPVFLSSVRYLLISRAITARK
jgi:hypothetical protein